MATIAMELIGPGKEQKEKPTVRCMNKINAHLHGTNLKEADAYNLSEWRRVVDAANSAICGM